MSSDPGPETDVEHIQDEHVPHEAEVVETIDEQMRRTSDAASIADVAVLEATDPAISVVAAPSAEYVEAEAGAARTAINALITQGAATEANVISLDAKVNAILDVLRDAELIPMPAPPG